MNRTWTEAQDRERLVEKAYELAKEIDRATPGGLKAARKSLEEAGKDYANNMSLRPIYRELARAMRNLEE